MPYTASGRFVKKPKKIALLKEREDFTALAQEYDELSKQIKMLETAKKNLADRLKEAAELQGVKDDKGSFYLDLNGFVIGKVAKKSISLNSNRALSFLKDKGMTNCIETVEQVNEKALEQEVSCGNITMPEFESLTDTKVTYSVSVKPKEELAEVDISSFAAARKK